MTDIDDAVLQAIRKRVEAATKGPWSVNTNGTVIGRNMVVVSSIFWSGRRWPNKEDAEFIAHARQDIPHLLAYCAALERELGRPGL
jgi:hypothetical protein